MLEDSLFESRREKKARNPLTVVVSAVMHVVTVGVLVLIPLVQTQALTLPKPDVSLLMPHVPKPVSVAVFSANTSRKAPQHTPAVSTALLEPRVIPLTTVTVPDPPSADLPGPPVGNGPGFTSLLDSLSNRGGPEVTAPTAPRVDPPAPPLPAPPPASAKPVRMSAGAQAANLIYQVKPTYPVLARQARIQGIVVLEAIINKQGAIDSLHIISGHPLLNQAALDAVKQWRYRPATLNTEPVDVITTVTVTFTLQ